ncbi:MAG: hypothetical protein SynsKO_20190 [Synoicihabitans sp.]
MRRLRFNAPARAPQKGLGLQILLLIWVSLGGMVVTASAEDWLAPPVPHFAEGMSKDEVKSVILDLLPELKDSHLGEAEKAELIRDWLHEFLPIADGYCDLWNLGADHNNDGLGKLFYMCEMRLGGYYCGGQAEIARKVYELLGFETFTFNYGIPNTRATHVTTFVKLDVGGEPRWTIQDVYFNFTLRELDGEYLGIRRLIDLVAARDFAEIVVDEKIGARTPVLHTEPGRMPRLNRRYNLESECVRPWDGFEEFTIKWDFQLFETTYFDLSQELTARLGDDNPLFLFLLPMGYKGPDQIAKIEEEIYAAQARLLADLEIDASQLTIPMTHPPKEYPPI